jgi:prevent-host-death family protein
MKSVNIHDAKTHFSRLVDAAMQGEEVIIAKAGRPAARLVPFTARLGREIRFGLMKGEIAVRDDFDAPLPDAVLADFEGRG